MLSRRTLALSAIVCGLSLPAWADEPDFQSWIRGVRRDALAQGIAAATLDRALGGVAPIPRVIELDRRQPESTLTFSEYIERVVSPQRRENARERLVENSALLDDVGARYGVPPRFIVALWGIETDFGRITGKFPVIDALATLAFEGRRAAFFRRELIDALRIIDRHHIDPHRMMGSWAGAMGQSQFMPSSFLTYAVSYRGEAAPDIWTRRDDVFASIANYLARVGWRGEAWGDAVRLPSGLDPATESKLKPVGAWAAQGVRRVDGRPLAEPAATAGLVAPQGVEGPVFLTYDNYRALLKWNNSSYFAVAVGYLADSMPHR
jgi:membrane-bound lytic murein transglycosylase B